MHYFLSLPNVFINHLPLVVGVLPILAAVVVGIGTQKRLGYWVATLLWALAVLLSGYLLVLAYSGTTWHLSLTWLRIPGPLPYQLRLAVRVDFPAAVMVSLTTTIGFIVHLYALAYLQLAKQRYVMLSGAFVSAMLGFWMAGNLLACFIGWELIGWGSYLLISFWYQQDKAARSATKAWLINQLGSVSLLIGILIIGCELGTFDLDELAAIPQASHSANGWLMVARLCLLGGVCAKSVQFPWFSWLPSAMTAPTPASALIHTATLVGAGVYLLVGIAPILGDTMLTWVAFIGGLTAFMGAYAALTQLHTKQGLAYSTISQLGYVVMAIGVGTSSAGLFHFATHAFAKACLFLCVGVVSRFLLQQGEKAPEDLRCMGGLRQVLPGVFYAYLIATCSLLGVPGFAGALSKEAILVHTWAWASEQALGGNYVSYLVPLLGLSTSLLTVLYMGRQAYLIFMGTPRWTPKLPPSYRTPWLMQASITALALGSLGFLYGPLDFQGSWLLQRLEHTACWPTTLGIIPAFNHGMMLASVSLLIMGVLWLLRWRPKRTTALPAAWAQLSLHGWYLDAFNHAVARGLLGLSRLTAQFNRQVVDGLVGGISVSYVGLGCLVSWLDRKLLNRTVSLIASVPQYLGKAHQKLQQGHLQRYLLWTFLGIGLLLGSIYWAMWSHT